MWDVLLDIALPRTDKGVAVQWIVAGAIWPIAIFSVRNQVRDIKLFVWGLVILNIALFSLRTVH